MIFRWIVSCSIVESLQAKCVKRMAYFRKRDGRNLRAVAAVVGVGVLVASGVLN